MSKKICIISPSVYPILADNKLLKGGGGAEAQLAEIGKGLVSKGYEVSYIVDDFGQAKVESIGSFSIHKVPLRYMGGSKFYLLPDWVRFFVTLWKINATYHIIKLPRNLFVPLGIYCRVRNRRFIFIGQIDNDVNIEKLIKQEGKISYYMYKLGMQWVDFVVAQNNVQLTGFVNVFNKDSRIIKSILTLPELCQFNKKNYVLWVGNSHTKKQPDIFIRLAMDLPDIQFIMIVAPTQVRSDDDLKKQAEQLGNLEYLGYVPFSKIAKYYQEAALFVSTSYLEGFPNTFLQSWQYETPVLSLHVNPSGVIEEYGLGKVSKTYNQLCVDTKEIMANDSVRCKFGVNAKEYVDKHHSRKVVINQYCDLLESMSE